MQTFCFVNVEIETEIEIGMNMRSKLGKKDESGLCLAATS